MANELAPKKAESHPCNCTSIEHEWGVPGCMKPETEDGLLKSLHDQCEERGIDVPEKATRSKLKRLLGQ